jgi:hypothetical protein
MKKALFLVALVAVSLPVLASQATDFSGKWTGSFSGPGPDGVVTTEPVIMNFVHKGAELAGTAGPRDDRQWKVEKGKVAGNTLSFEVQAGDSGPLLRFTLTYADGRLKGDVAAQRGNEKLNAKVDVARAK